MTGRTPEVITRYFNYFNAQASRDFDTLISLFTHDAVVIDEASSSNGFVAHVHLEGNFPAGTADLDYRFTLDGERIRRLEVS